LAKVLNRRRDYIPPEAVYIGRGSKWGNPYRIGDKAPYPYPHIMRIDRALSLKLFREYLKYHPELVAAAKIELRGKDLVCYCAPLPCHGDIWLEIANSD